ncbi:MAG: cobalamin biosynthesis protein CobQ, partial [Shimia sp.]
MNTPAHLLVGAAAFSRPGAAGVTAAALIGGLLPDASLYGLTLWELARGTSPDVIFRELYFSDDWQGVFAVDNSFVLWGLAFAVAWRLGPAWTVASTGAALLHLALDFPFHAEDARAHFWPISSWKFVSPISYWDGRAGGRW